MVAFDKMTGKEIWRALPSDTERGVASPIIIEAGGVRQLIIWYDGAVASLDPVTGKMYWQQPYKVGAAMSIATPVRSGSLLLFTNFYNGPLMLSLDDSKPAATVLWKGEQRQRNSDRRTALGQRHTGHRRGSRIRRLQLRSVSVSSIENR